MSDRGAQGGWWRSERGQTTVEWLMIAGLLTAIIIGVTQIVVPTVAYGARQLLEHMVVFLTSP